MSRRMQDRIADENPGDSSSAVFVPFSIIKHFVSNIRPGLYGYSGVHFVWAGAPIIFIKNCDVIHSQVLMDAIRYLSVTALHWIKTLIHRREQPFQFDVNLFFWLSQMHERLRRPLRRTKPLYSRGKTREPPERNPL